MALDGLRGEDVVLSIGKLAVGQAGYYLEQAQGSVTRAGAVASGVEDYYLGGNEAPGVWVGGGVRPLGLRGEVDAVRLDRVLGGLHPVSGEPLGRVVPRRVPGFDLTFSAPKSVSVLFGVGDDRMREAIRDAHDRAAAALGYVEREAGITRRGSGGAVAIRGRGLIGAAFVHRTSRAGDPQLHTHVLVANVIVGADGRWGTLDGRRIYAHAKTAGYLYELRLRAELTRTLGVEWGEVRNGIADVAGVSPEVRRAFSRRRAEIEAEMARRGTESAGAAQVAALATRRAKDYRVTPDRLAPEWRKRAAALGLDARAIGAVERRRAVPALAAVDVDAVFALLAGPGGLTAQRSSFTRRELLQALASWLPVGTDAHVDDLERLADRFLGCDLVVALAVGERIGQAEGVQPHDVVAAERRYSTAELLARERVIVDHALQSIAGEFGVGRERAVEGALRWHPSIAAEQAEMVRRLVLGGDGVAVVIGQAGTGKTFALGAAREAWEHSGHRVIGAALARRAALELADGAGIESTSVAELLDKLRRRPASTLTRRSVLVIDEAGMVPTRALAEIVEHAARAGAKLVLVGDDHQLPEIGAGGAFRALARRLPAIELRENRRQAAAWEREALALLRGGDADAAASRYEARGRIVAGRDAGELRGRLVADWWRAGDPDGGLMIAHRRRDVADLNGRARALMRATGAVTGPDVQVGGAEVAKGDRIVVRRNDRGLGVVNGERGVVAAVDPVRQSATVRLKGRTVELRGEHPEIALGYAITGHQAQGSTCSRAFVLATDGISKEWAYVALSRGRDENRLYVTREHRDEWEFAPDDDQGWTPERAVRNGLVRSAAQRLALDEGGDSRGHVRDGTRGGTAGDHVRDGTRGGTAGRHDPDKPQRHSHAELVAVADELRAARAELAAAELARDQLAAAPPRRRWLRRAPTPRSGLGSASLAVTAAAERVAWLQAKHERLQRDLRESGARERAVERPLPAIERVRRADFGIER